MTDLSHRPFVTVLGIAQDGGYPHIGCRGPCCREAWENRALQRRVTALGLTDPRTGRCWLFEATPDIRWQIHALLESEPPGAPPRELTLAGLFLTHAHLGHYLGLAMLGREAMAAERIPVHVMPRLRRFLETNGPWKLLVEVGNIELCDLSERRAVELAEDLRVTPFSVPHRGEFSETVGFRIAGTEKTAMFLPDIDGWESWHERVPDAVRSVSVAYLDGTFFDRSELPGRSRAEIPHPPVAETMSLLSELSPEERGRVRFLHLNHSNPLLHDDSPEARRVRERGFRIATEGERLSL